MAAPRRILFHMPNNPGDVVMALFVVDAWYNQYPEDELHFLCDLECLDLVHKHPQIHKAWATPRHLIRQASTPAQAIQALEEHLTLLQEIHWDIIVNLYQGSEGAQYLSLLRAHERRGLDVDLSGIPVLKDPWLRYLFTIPAQRSANTYHVIDLYLRIAGLNVLRRPQAQFPASPMGNLAQHCIALQTSSAWIGKRWPTKSWRELIVQLLDLDTRIHFCLLGAPSEAEDNEILCQINPNRIVNLCGKSRLHHLFGILAESQLLITGDTFAMHVASAVHTPVIALFGPSNPIETGPYAQGAWVLSPKAYQLQQNLEFDQQSIISQIQVQDIIQVIQGQKPSSACLREGCWDRQSNCHNWLIDGIKSPSPHPNPWTQICESDRVALTLVQSMIADLQSNLIQCTGNGLQKIEDQEKQLAQLTPNSLFWEYYRLALASIDWRDFRAYLQGRLDLLGQQSANI